MCTVSYLPLSNSEFILCSNRDEKHTRALAIKPEIKKFFGKDILCPIDSKGNGTWIFANKEITACLLNGAFKGHISKEKYRMSRGKVVLNILQYANIHDFSNNITLEDIEPFTLILVQKLHKIEIIELRWDGTNKHIKKLNPLTPQLWSSSTLYKPEIILEREKLFQESNIQNKEDLLKFHQLDRANHEDISIMLKTPTHRTVSTTIIENKNDKVAMEYLDYVKESRFTLKLE